MLNPVTDAVRTRLAEALPDAALRSVEPRYLEEPRGSWAGQAGVVVAPGSTDDVAATIRIAAEERVPVLPYGGGTGLVGGQVMPEGPAPILISLERMTRIRGVHPSENLLVAEAGAVLAHIQDAAEDADRLFPLSLGSEGTARIGGLLSTNAGGVNVLRYGNARELCLGIEAVLPDGSVMGGLKRLRKDNTGYDLKDLLIGAEGTLGVITAATLRLFPRPAETGAALMAVESPAAALALLARAGEIAGPGLTAFELISGQGLRFMEETGFDLRRPFDEIPDWMVLIDLGLSAGQDPSGLLETVFVAGYEAGWVQDGVIAQSEAQRRAFWTLRETIPQANRAVGAISSHDISVPISAVPGFIAEAGARLAARGDYRINCFGHMGDGNLHYNVFPLPGEAKADRAHEREAVQELVHDLAVEMDGSFSAEHGIGRLKVGDLERYGDPGRLAAMRAIKAALDPAGIMNPGAVLRPSG